MDAVGNQRAEARPLNDRRRDKKDDRRDGEDVGAFPGGDRVFAHGSGDTEFIGWYQRGILRAEYENQSGGQYIGFAAEHDRHPALGQKRAGADSESDFAVAFGYRADRGQRFHPADIAGAESGTA